MDGRRPRICFDKIVGLLIQQALHKHPHHVTHKKKWGEYLLEFSMLFLAVFLGFVTENIREHKVEQDRAQVLAKSMLEDLKKDTASIRMGIEKSEQVSMIADSLINLMLSPINKWDTICFLKKYAQVASAYNLRSVKSTFEQLKTSGSLRYFEQDLINLMNAYYLLVSNSDERDAIELKLQLENATPLLLNNINMLGFSEVTSGKPLTLKQNITFNTKEEIQRFSNMIMIGKIAREISASQYKEQLYGALKLIEALKAQYHLK